MAGITTESIEHAIQAAIAETKLYVNTRAVLLPTIEQFNVPNVTYQVPFLSGGTVYKLAENESVTTSDMSTTGEVIVAESRIISVLVSRLAEMSTPENFGIKVGQQFGLQMTECLNRDIFALGDQFSNSIGATDEPITLDLIKQAKFELEKANAPGQYTLAITLHVMDDLVDAIFDSTSGTSAYSALRAEYEATGAIKMIYGVNLAVVSDLAPGTSAGQKDAASIKCSMYAKPALGINIATPFSIKSETKIEKADSQLFVGSVDYGVKKLVNAYGVELVVQNKDA